MAAMDQRALGASKSATTGTGGALMGEDRSRSRHPNLLANLALIRSGLLAALAARFPHRPLPEIREQLHSRPGQCLALLAKS